ncbi:MAG TPA: hypothetical protein VFQ84_12320 [Arenimonas sp.]|uniref:hypothetical protein n=1 Tax=Arenimonas sp. TaxID=1872635 RepID=UPI002D8112B0|nr:hypothetical protein [Arenimonas sp.]HEU0154117.1 hypothetical protein [Arenimonas sp.]
MRLALILAAALLTSGCDAPKPDPTPETVPEPQATHTELRDAMQAPVDKARAVEDTQAEDEAERQRALEEAGG